MPMLSTGRIGGCELDTWTISFWFATLVLIPSGLGMTLFAKRRMKSFGILAVVVGCSFILLTTVLGDSSSFEREVSLTLLASLGPSILMGCSILLLIFTSDSPVKPLPRPLRWLGWVGMLSGLGWILALALLSPPTSSGGAVSEVWTVWLTGFLLTLLALGLTSIVFLLSMGEARYTEILCILPLPVGAGLMLNHALTSGFKGLAPEVALGRFADASLMLMGTVIGMTAAVFLFGLVLYISERGITQLPTTSPLTDDEMQLIRNRVERGRQIVEQIDSTTGGDGDS
ncbi:MAG: hypothetical protein CL992_04950 [Euryarchaeota archaeon]|nr:hypothetical protein [Euryarchaeota archaeon]